MYVYSTIQYSIVIQNATYGLSAVVQGTLHDPPRLDTGASYKNSNTPGPTSSVSGLYEFLLLPSSSHRSDEAIWGLLREIRVRQKRKSDPGTEDGALLCESDAPGMRVPMPRAGHR